MKRTLLATYYYSSLLLRRWHSARACRAGHAPVMILFYHRVADEYPNDWTMPTRQFERQLSWLLRHCDLVSLEQAQERIRSGRIERPTVSITFDDGYADNCRFALPLLVRYGVPCTYFVSVQNVTRSTPFPHDVAAGQPLEPNTIDQLRELSNRRIEIGLHTRTHADLGKVTDRAQLQDEIVGAGRDLAKLLDRPIRYFAFPYGLHENLSCEAFHVVREAGYLGVCSAYGGYNFPGDDAFHLQRIHADPEWVRWKNWLTVDPRKIRLVQRFQCPPEDHAVIERPTQENDRETVFPSINSPCLHDSSSSNHLT